MKIDYSGQLERTYIRALGIFMAVFALVLVFGLIYPLYHAETLRLRSELTQEAERTAVYADLFIKQSNEQVAAMVSRTQIRLELVKYASGLTSLEDLKTYTQAKYLDGLSVYDNLIAAVRYEASGCLVASKGDISLLPYASLQVGQRKLNVLAGNKTDTDEQRSFYLEIRHPILDKGIVVGQDALLFDAKAFNTTIGQITYRLVATAAVDTVSEPGSWNTVKLSNPSLVLSWCFPPEALLPDLSSLIRPFLRFSLLLLPVAGLLAYFTLYRASRAVLESHRNLAERRALMIQETNHRVKNNLSIISSLVHLYRMEGHDEGGKLQDIESRINLIGLIHDRLYREPDTELVELNSYIKELVEAIMVAHATPGTYTYSIEGPEIYLPDDVCCSIGFIVSELAINSLKYALSPGDGIHIKLSKNEIAWSLDFDNNGKPFPATVDPLTSTSFGMELIRGYARQLGARLSFYREPKTRYLFEFKA